MGHHEANQLKQWLTMKQINLYYGSLRSTPICTMAHNEADQIIGELRCTTKQITLYFSSSRGRSKYLYIMDRNGSDPIRTQNKGDVVKS
jgi:Tol biopolymer transport system component